MQVNIVIPMAGRGSRFANVGFVQPKPLIDVAGKPMISWVVDNVDSSAIDAHFIFLVLKEHEDKFNLSVELKKLKPNVSVVLVDQVTEGAACTVLLSRALIDNETPLFIANSDQFVEWSADAYWSTLAADSSDGDVLCFKIPMEKNDTKWSYAKIDNAGHVTDIQEKVVISENATVGYYYWKRGSDYVRLADQMIAKNIRVNGEFYVAPVYNEGVLEGMKYKLSFCDKMWGLGVPHDLTSFLTNYVRPRMPVRATNTSPARGPMRFIAHRGNLYGADPINENKPEHLQRALDLGFDIELDVRYFPDKDEWWLGHDEPQYQVPFEFLLKDRLWIHCKNGAALQRLAKDERVNCFFHDVDDFVLTSKDYIWIYPEKPLQGPTSIAVMFKDSAALLDKDIFGICSDDVGLLRKQYVAMHSAAESGPPIELVIFDLDGVLVESKDLHYDALNRAIEEVAGAEFVIKRAEHESVYDGLSTNQKLRLMTISKGLPLELHKPVWVRKQELTDELVREQLKPSAELLASLKALKLAGYPVAVASNCIKSSVHNILDSIGALPLVDAYLSNEDVKHPKPDPDIYSKACSVFGVSPACAIVVEDSPKGFESSIRAGCNLFKVKGPHEVVSDVILDHIGALNASVKPITVVVPLAAPSQQYWIDGPESVPCEIPSFLADANGSPAIRWVVEPILKSRYALKFVFIVKESQMAKFKLSSLLPRIVDFRPTVVVPVHGETLGALKTVLMASDAIDADAPVLLVTCSNVTTWLPGTSVDDMFDAHADGAVATFESSDPRCSYVRLDSNTDDILDIHEKLPVSNMACTGLYYWKHAATFFSSAKSLIKHQVRHKGMYFLAPVYNEAIRSGFKFKVAAAKGCLSVRDLKEVGDFAEAYVSSHVDDSMKSIYDEMAARQMSNIVAKGYSYDAVLSGEHPARCFAAYTLCTFDNLYTTGSFDLLMGRLDDVFSEQHVIYRLRPTGNQLLFGHLHMTLMQLIGFNVYGTIPIPDDYAEVLEAILLRTLHPFEVHFNRVIVTPASVLLVGHPTISLNHVREQIRRSLARIGYPLYEPYKNDIAHMTLVRFAAPLAAAQQLELQKVCHDFSRHRLLAKLNVNTIDVSAASWKMQPAELEAETVRRVLLRP